MKRLLPLYPRAWRERYGAEMETDLAEMSFDPRTAFDLVACAIDAHLHQPRRRRRWSAGLPVVGQVAVLVVAAMVVLPQVRQLLDGPVLSMPGGSLVFSFIFIPAAIPALAAIASWRAGWSLGSWFCGLLAADVAVSSGDGWLWNLMSEGRSVLEPVRLAVSAWHPAWFRLGWPYAAAVVVLGVALSALLLRRIGLRWPIGLGIGVLLVASIGFVPLALSLRPGSSIADVWLINYAQWAAWGALTAAVLRRGGLGWWAALPSGVILGPLLSNAWLSPGNPWPLPGVAWAALLAAIVCRRGAEPAPLEAAP